MAIKSGSPGLKYPITNYAQIAAQQSDAAAAAGGSASASAYGANRSFAANKMRVAADLYNSQQDRLAQAYQADQQRGFSAYQADQDRGFRAQSQLEAQGFQAGQNALQRQQAIDLQKNYQTFQQQQAQQGLENQQGQNQGNFDLQTAATEANIKAGRLQLPAAAQAELDKLEASRVEADQLDNKQLAEFEQQYRAKKAGLLALATPTQTNQERFDQSIVTRNGQEGQLDQNGRFIPIPPNPQQDAQQKAQQQASEAEQKRAQAQAESDKKIYHDLMQQRDKETGQPLYTDETARAQIDRANKAYGTQPIGPSPGVGPAPTGYQPGVTTGPNQPPPVPQPPPETEPLLPNGQRMNAAADSGTPSVYPTAPGQQPLPVTGTVPLPPGMPAGSRAIDSDNILLPDGTIIRRRKGS